MLPTMTLTYAHSSFAAGKAVSLATGTALGPSGLVEGPHFFSGFVLDAEQCARGILAVANVAATSYYTRVEWSSLDPVVTSDGERLRFESFSGCGGVYARFDLLPEALDGEGRELGTTNVDVNPPLRLALATIRSGEPLRLDVGDDEVVASTRTASVTERKVKLPERWIRGFGEASVAAAAMRPVAEIGATEAQRFLRSLPRSGGGVRVVPSGRTLRITASPSSETVYLDGAARLKELLPLLRFARSLRVHGADGTGGTARASAWELVLRDARLTLTLSPQLSRGFSGEGGVLFGLASGDGADADAVLDHLAWTPGADLATLSFALGWEEPRTVAALTRLGTSGRIGYDTGDGRYFHRELPYDAEKAARRNPRLVGAQRLVDDGAVDWVAPDRAQVRTGEHAQTVRRVGDAWACTCEWYQRYEGTRGPCKHVLAAELTR